MDRRRTTIFAVVVLVSVLAVIGEVELGTPVSFAPRVQFSVSGMRLFPNGTLALKFGNTGDLNLSEIQLEVCDQAPMMTAGDQNLVVPEEASVSLRYYVPQSDVRQTCGVSISANQGGSRISFSLNISATSTSVNPLNSIDVKSAQLLVFRYNYDLAAMTVINDGPTPTTSMTLQSLSAGPPLLNFTRNGAFVSAGNPVPAGGTATLLTPVPVSTTVGYGTAYFVEAIFQDGSAAYIYLTF